MILNLPDDVTMNVPLEHMAVKDSIFVPTLKIEETRSLVARTAKEIEITVASKTAVVDGYLGIVFWRTA